MARSETKATTLWKLATLKPWLGVTDQAENSQDAEIVKCADAASEFIERYTRRKFVIRSFTETRDGDGSREMFLFNFPVVALTSLTVLRSPTDVSPETIPSTYYSLNKSTGKIYTHSDRFTKGVGNVVATYTAGYDAKDGDSLPQDIYTMGMELVKLLWNEATQNNISVSTVNIGNHTFMLKPEWPKQIKATLDNWKRIF